MLRLAHRTTRATTAGLLGLLLAAPPPSRADDDDEGKRSRGHVARQHPSHRDDDEGSRGKGKGGDGRNERRAKPQPQRVERARQEQHARPDRRAPSPQVVRRSNDRHEHRDRYEHRDRSEWRDDHREWRDERREEWREHQEWSHARYTAHHGNRWHWHGNRWCPPGHRHPPGRHVGWSQPHHDDWRWARYRRPAVVHSQYYCAPCSGWYGDRYAFDQHVYGYHRLPQLSFGDAVSQMVWGLVYFGQ